MGFVWNSQKKKREKEEKVAAAAAAAMHSGKEGKGGTATPIAESDSEIEHEPGEKNVSRQMSESSLYTTEDEEEDETHNKIELGPQCTLKEQFEKDKVFLSLPLNFFFLV